MAEESCVACFCCPFLFLLRHISLFLNPAVLYILFGFGFGRLFYSPDDSPPSSFGSYPYAFPPSLYIPETSFPCPIASARAEAGGSVSMDNRTARSGEWCGHWCMQFVISAKLQAKTLNMQYNFTIVVLQTVANRLDLDAGLSHSTVVWGMWWFVRVAIGARGFWYQASIVFELPIWLNYYTLIVTSTILLGSGFGNHLDVREIGENLKRNQPT